MPATKVTGRHVRIEATLDGVVITRSKPRAQQHNVQRTDLIGWDRILGARVEQSRSGRPVVRLAVSDTAVLQHHKDDPFSVKLKRSSITTAQEFVAYATHEVDVRGRWRKQA